MIHSIFFVTTSSIKILLSQSASRCVKIMAKEHIYKVLKGEVDKNIKNSNAGKRKHGEGDEAAPAPDAAQPEDVKSQPPPKKGKAKK